MADCQRGADATTGLFNHSVTENAERRPTYTNKNPSCGICLYTCTFLFDIRLLHSLQVTGWECKFDCFIKRISKNGPNNAAMHG